MTAGSSGPYGIDSVILLWLAQIGRAGEIGQAPPIGDGAACLPAVHVEDSARTCNFGIEHVPAGSTLPGSTHRPPSRRENRSLQGRQRGASTDHRVAAAIETRTRRSAIAAATAIDSTMERSANALRVQTPIHPVLRPSG